MLSKIPKQTFIKQKLPIFAKYFFKLSRHADYIKPSSRSTQSILPRRRFLMTSFKKGTKVTKKSTYIFENLKLIFLCFKKGNKVSQSQIINTRSYFRSCSLRSSRFRRWLLYVSYSYVVYIRIQVKKEHQIINYSYIQNSISMIPHSLD